MFADFMKPGYHQLLIYDPKANRAYCKDFIVNMNTKDNIFPEYPLHDKTPLKKVSNVWRKCKDDVQ